MEFVVVDRLLLCLRSRTDLPPMNCTAMKQESIAPTIFYSANSFRSAAALAVFVPPSQPLSKYHVVINAGALRLAI